MIRKIITGILCTAMLCSGPAMNSVFAESTDNTGDVTIQGPSIEEQIDADDQALEGTIDEDTIEEDVVEEDTIEEDVVEEDTVKDDVVEISKPKVRTKAALPKIVKAKPKKTYISVTWSKVKDSKGYYVYKSTKKNGKYKKIKTLKSWKSTNYKDKKIKPKKRYYYKVMPRNKSVNKGRVTASVKISNPKIASAKLNIKKSLKVKAYAYTGGGRTKMGNKCKVGRIAVDPRVIKLGSWLYVEGYGYAQACDTGGNIKGKTIDVYKNTSKQVNSWGVKHPKVYVLD